MLVDGLEYREGLNAVRLGGVAKNVDSRSRRHRGELATRFAPNQSADEAVQFVRVFADADEVEIVDSADGARPGLDAPFALGFVRVVGSEPRAKVGWTDVARFSALGIPSRESLGPETLACARR